MSRPSGEAMKRGNGIRGKVSRGYHFCVMAGHQRVFRWEHQVYLIFFWTLPRRRLESGALNKSPPSAKVLAGHCSGGSIKSWLYAELWFVIGLGLPPTKDLFLEVLVTQSVG